MYPSSIGWKRTLAAGTTLTVTFLLVIGYSARSRAKMVSICARACSMVRPSASRPFTKSQRVPLRSMRVAPGSSSAVACMPEKTRRSTIITGTQNSVGMPGSVPVNPRGATPTIV